MSLKPLMWSLAIVVAVAAAGAPARACERIAASAIEVESAFVPLSSVTDFALVSPLAVVGVDAHCAMPAAEVRVFAVPAATRALALPLGVSRTVVRANAHALARPARSRVRVLVR